jgi:type I restriction enzyme, S subunit
MPTDALDVATLTVPTGWECAPLDRLVDEERGISYGIVQPGQHDADGVPIVRVNNLRGGRILTDDVLRVSSGIEANYKRTRLRGGEILLSLVGTLGESAVVPPKLAGWNVARAVAVIPLKADIDPRWVAMCLRSAGVQDLMRAWATTTVQATLNLRDVRRLPILLAPQPDRGNITRAITEIDEKIEQNRRTGRALEGFARAVFKAWFVDFEPVKAKAAGAAGFPGMPPAAFAALPARFTGSPLGPVPEGWTLGTMGNIGEQRREQIAPDETDSDTPYIGLEHMPRRDIMLSEWGVAASVTSSKFRFRRDDILFGKLRPYFHKVGSAPLDGVCSTDIVVLYPKRPDYAAWLLMLISSDDFVAHTDRSSAGTKMPRTNWKDMAVFGVTVPPSALASVFEEQAGPMLELITASIHESRKLAALRDYLLPRLLSGRVRVRDRQAQAEVKA